MIEDAFNDFKEEVEYPLHWQIPVLDLPKVPKQYKTTILQHKQNEPIVKTEVNYVDTTR